MKRIFLPFLALTFLLVGCGDDQAPDLSEFGQWELVIAQGSWPVDGTLNYDPGFEEYYSFNANGTFSRTRMQGENVTSASGVYERIEATHEHDKKFIRFYLQLNYESGEELIGSCVGGGVEGLYLHKEGHIQNTWGACDGPTYIYHRRNSARD
jgi:hypothetical protein